MQQPLTLEIRGMTCGHCVKSVNAALSKVDGVTIDNVTIGSAAVTFDPARTSANVIAEAVREEGYEVVSRA
ncbi:MAG: heavy-metal-associated domain-containing protein [Gemmatimonadaceae bacterium]|nr:heavy-metal-associated domain-containing protein [Gemmatimonadaceae bacterium]